MRQIEYHLIAARLRPPRFVMAYRSLRREAVVQFTMLEYKARVPERAGCYLIKDSWNDYGFVTTFELVVRPTDTTKVRIGFLRIAHVSMHLDGTRRTSDLMPGSFTSLDNGFFSLGHEDDYYVRMQELPEGMGHDILTALNDIAYGPGVEPSTKELDVYRDSLLRDRSPQGLSTANLVAHGMRARIVPFCWSYTPDQEGLLAAQTFTFEAVPGSLPSTNLHALIGRNGVGKSRLLHNIAKDAAAEQISVQSSSGGTGNSFTSCVVVSFSPFDEPYYRPAAASLSYHYIGLHHHEEQRLKTKAERRKEFVDSFAIARIGSRGARWSRAVRTLNYAASGFLDEHMNVIQAMIREGSSKKLEKKMGDVFESLSSGHAVVLLMVTRLIEVVGERTLVLIDEPETHLHPPLLSALTRALSDLLADRNGMAVVATHSPVVLQEVPASCVWRLIRNGAELTAHRPGLETYGESVGELTYDAFGLEVTSTGFHATIADQVREGGSYEEITARFSGLGAEARSLLRAMTLARAQGER